MRKTSVVGLLMLFCVIPAQAGEVHVAVAANFTAPMKVIAAEFEKATGHQAKLSFGSTGKFYAQISNGAPFELLLSADDETPARMEREGLAVAGTRITYAFGKLVLWSSKVDVIDGQVEVLKKGNFKYLSIAAPKLAPYGAAAIQTLKSLDLLAAIEPKLVQGENIAQAYQFVATGNADLGFVALSQVQENGQIKSGSAWVVPDNLYSPIRQDMVILNKGRTNPAAKELLKFIKSEAARAIILSYGYAL
ncbi:MAG: molybdate ABC transporter substrate-binding protein [Burkholderiales bacterium]